MHEQVSLVDTVVHSAAIQDRDGAGLVLHKTYWHIPSARIDLGRWRLQRRAGRSCRGQRCRSLRIEIVKRSDDMKGFVVPLRRRWVVQRTLRLLEGSWRNH
jgi:hypothetical protein